MLGSILMYVTLICRELINDVRLVLSIQADLLFSSDNVVAVEHKGCGCLKAHLLWRPLAGGASCCHVVGVLGLTYQALINLSRRPLSLRFLLSDRAPHPFEIVDFALEV